MSPLVTPMLERAAAIVATLSLSSEKERKPMVWPSPEMQRKTRTQHSCQQCSRVYQLTSCDDSSLLSKSVSVSQQILCIVELAAMEPLWHIRHTLAHIHHLPQVYTLRGVYTGRWVYLIIWCGVDDVCVEEQLLPEQVIVLH